MNEKRLRILVVGAHPDDPDFSCGGTAALWAAAGHVVRFVSTTNGDTGHHAIGGIELARRRRAEAQASAALAGIEAYEILDNHNGELEPTVVNRRTLLALIRQFGPDLVLSHRPYDYHPDHRATGQLVMDTSYVITVPNNLALTDALLRPPVIMSLFDTFSRPCPFQADVVVGIDEVIERKFDMLHCHVSQVYEWLAFNQGVLDQVPSGEAERRRWLAERYRGRFEEPARRYRAKLVERYGAARGNAFRYAEAFEVSEYGAQPDEKEIRRLFPFFA
jgi:LmbE family N-acetylglucosaminyl deacetylase